jgi:hypothetical protein
MDPYYQRMFNPQGFRDKQFALAQSLRSGTTYSWKDDKGVMWKKTPDWDLKRKLDARSSPQQLARDKEVEARTGEPQNLVYYYADPSGKRFSGTFLGDGDYGGFGTKETKRSSYSKKELEKQQIALEDRVARDPRRQFGWGASDLANVEEREALQKLNEGSARAAARANPKEAPEGYVYNRYGNLEPEDWYIEDEETGEVRRKTLQEYRASRK